MKTLSEAEAGEQIDDRFDVVYRNENTKGAWYRWCSVPAKDIQDCHKWIKEYGKPDNICGMLHIPGNNFKTEFKILKLERTVVETATR